MKNNIFSRNAFGFALLLAAGIFTLVYTACNPEDTNQVVTATQTDTDVTYYLDLIKTCQATGNVVYFQTEGDNRVANPSEEWIKNWANDLSKKAADRAIVDLYTIEVRPTNGASFDKMLISIAENWTFGSSGCVISGDVLISSPIPCPSAITCPEITAKISGSGECNTPGRCRIIVHRTTSTDCACFAFSSLVNLPLSSDIVSLGNYCCTVNYCW